MTEISQLSPAVSLALLNFSNGYDSSNSTYREMLKATLFELLLAKALAATSEKDEDDTYTTISRGPAFTTYQFQPHQQVFKDCLTEPLDLEDYIHEVYKKGGKSFHEAIKGQMQGLGLIEQVTKKRLLFFTSKSWALSLEGVVLRRQLREARDEGERLAALGTDASPDQLKRLTVLMGFNVVLLASFSPLLMQEWNSIMATLPRPGGDSFSGSDLSGVSDVGEDSSGWDWLGSFGDSDFSAGFEGAFESGGSGGDWSDGGSGGEWGGDSGGDSGGDGGGDGGGGSSD